MQGILIATLVVGVVGLVLGLALVTASKKFYVETDERVTQVRECLRGANCGACGYAGCDAVAEAIVKGEPIPQPGIPESFRVMLKELQSLGMDVVVQDKDGNEIDMRQNFDDEETGFDMRDVAGTETVVQESELTDYNIKDADAGFDDPSVLEDDNSGAEAPAASDEVDF